MRIFQRTCCLLSVGLAITVGAFACRAPLRGTDFGHDRDFYRHEDALEPEKWSEAPVHRLILIGDTGRPTAEDPTLALLGRWGDERPDRTTVLFLGDNLYPAGLQAGDPRGERVLLQQLRSTRARKILVPGNHDWGFTGVQRMASGVLANQQEFVEKHADLAADFQPKDGCPGPATVELVESGPALEGGLVVILLDLHWWLLPPENRPVCEGVADTKVFVEKLREELARHRDRNLIVAAHHPLRSGGPHGGFTRGFWFDLGVAIFYRLYTVQDLIEPTYREMIVVLSEVLGESPPLAVVGGHDHSLQILDGGDIARLALVSGSGSDVTGVTSIEGTLFAHAHLGFLVLDFHDVEGERKAAMAVHVVETGVDDGAVFTLGVDLGREDAPPERLAAP